MHSLLIRNGLILTMNDRMETFQNGYVAVQQDTITEIGPTSREHDLEAEIVIDARGGIVMPGLVNTHTHAAMTIFRGLADDMPLMDWLNRYIFPIEKNLSAEWVYWGTRLAAVEMIRSGTTTFCDMYLFEDQAAQAAKDTGIRAMVGEVLYDFDSPSYGKLENGYRVARDLALKWQGDPLISVAIQPHSPYTCSPELLRGARKLAEDLAVPVVTHLSESDSEVTTVLERYGKRPVDHLDSLGLLDGKLIADHCVALLQSEIELFAERDVAVSHNVESNMKLASGVSPVPELLRCGVRVGLGTDGCASNNNLNLFGEMDAAAKLHKVMKKDPTQMDAKTVVTMATRGGARTLGMADGIGSIEPGKKADLIVLDTGRAHMIPMYNPYSHIVYAANGSEVTCSIVNGRPVLLDGQIQTVDEEEVFAHVRRIAEQINRIVGHG